MNELQKKQALYGFGILGILWLIFRKPSTDSTTSIGSEDPTGNGSSTPNTPMYVFNAAKVADELYEAMRYNGTDEDAIMSALQHVNQTQFAQVFSKFGKIQYNKTLGNQVNPTAWIDDLPFVDLRGWLKNELSDADYKILRLKYPSYL